MKDFKAMPKKILAGVTTVVALSGFVPAINAASPTATANIGAEVLIQQAITINVGAPVNFGTIILSNATVAGNLHLWGSGGIVTTGLIGEMSHAGGQAVGTMAINSSAGAVNIALGASPTDDGGNLSYARLMFDGPAVATGVWPFGNENVTVNLIGGSFNIGAALIINSKPNPGTYTGKSFAITVTDI